MLVILVIVMFMESILDIKTRQVWMVPPVLLMTVGILWNVWQMHISVVDLLLVVVTILGLGIVSVASREALGMGDVWLIGSILGVQGILPGLESIVIAFVLSGIYGGIQFLWYRTGKKSFPMAPFLLAGILGGVWLT